MSFGIRHNSDFKGTQEFPYYSTTMCASIPNKSKSTRQTKFHLLAMKDIKDEYSYTFPLSGWGEPS
jgi:hypothetical protein